MTWEIIFQAMGVVVAAVLGTTQVMTRLPKSRATLKHDLEVLKLLDRTHPKRELIERHVLQSIERIYIRDRRGWVKSGFVVHQWDDFVIGIVCLFGGSLWTLYLVRDGFTWWALLTGFVAFGGFGAILNGLEDKAKRSDG